jgi:hypothetical protein
MAGGFADCLIAPYNLGISPKPLQQNPYHFAFFGKEIEQLQHYFGSKFWIFPIETNRAGAVAPCR